LAVACATAPACYTGGGRGTDPPSNTFYFPVGLAVSAGGNVLYAVNSDFDLQWNGGTLQSYDLFKIRNDTLDLITANLKGNPPPPQLHYVVGLVPGQCVTGQVAPDGGPVAQQSVDNNLGRIPLGQGCAPPVDTTPYVRNSVIIGAFATDLQLQFTPPAPPAMTPGVGHRLFMPVRGNATLTWADVDIDDPNSPPPGDGNAASGSNPFVILCQGRPGACHSGSVPDPADTRNQTMPGEPFGMGQLQDGSAIAITHQSTTQTSLLLAGSPSNPPGLATSVDPSMQFVLENVAAGGSSIASVPHDPDSSVPPCPPGVTPFPVCSPAPDGGAVGPCLSVLPTCVRPAFLETSRSSAEIDLLRYYDDDGTQRIDGGVVGQGGLKRPFLAEEVAFPVATNGSSDLRGIAIDPTPRIACKATHAASAQACADGYPARVYIASRSPSSRLIAGTIGGPSPSGDGSYQPDLLTLAGGEVSLPPGASRVYLAPIVNLEGNYELRVFVVNFDSATISIIDPNKPLDAALVDTIYVGPGPFAMAFDPFSLDDVATNQPVRADMRPGSKTSGQYRFGYVASFTQSFVQVIDLDQSSPTYESVVFTLGKPTPPKGS
jgi:hypothetical protein